MNRECDCSARSSEMRVFICPVCSSKAYRVLLYLDIEAGSQMDLFEEEKGVSVSALNELAEFELEQARFVARLSDGLPF